MADCPFHGPARLSSCGHCRRAVRQAEYAQRSHATHRQYRTDRRAAPNRPPPTDVPYDYPERSTAEDVHAIMQTMLKEFGR